MKTSISLMILLACGLYACTTSSNSGTTKTEVTRTEVSPTETKPEPIKERPKTAEEIKMELRDQERISPLKYIKCEPRLSRHKMVIQEASTFRSEKWEWYGFDVSGTIHNTASVAQFKDVILTFICYSKTNTEMYRLDKVYYEFFEPNSTKQISDFYVKPPNEWTGKDGSTWRVEVKSAIATQ